MGSLGSRLGQPARSHARSVDFRKCLKASAPLRRLFSNLARWGVSGLWAAQTLGRLCLFTQSGRRPGRRSWPCCPPRSGCRGRVLGFLGGWGEGVGAHPPAREERRPVRWVPSNSQGGPATMAPGAGHQGSHHRLAPALPTRAPAPRTRSRGRPQRASRGRGVPEAHEEEN